MEIVRRENTSYCLLVPIKRMCVNLNLIFVEKSHDYMIVIDL